MPTKTKTSKTRTRMKKLPSDQKGLSKEQKKRVKGGLLPGNTAVTPIGGVWNTTGSPVGGPVIPPVPRYTLSSPMVGVSAQLLASELSATR